MGIVRSPNFHNSAWPGDAVDFIHRLENAVKNLNRILADDDIKRIVRERPRRTVEIVHDIDAGLFGPVNSDGAWRFIPTAADVKNFRWCERLTSRCEWS